MHLFAIHFYLEPKGALLSYLYHASPFTQVIRDYKHIIIAEYSLLLQELLYPVLASKFLVCYQCNAHIESRIASKFLNRPKCIYRRYQVLPIVIGSPSVNFAIFYLGFERVCKPQRPVARSNGVHVCHKPHGSFIVSMPGHKIWPLGVCLVDIIIPFDFKSPFLKLPFKEVCPCSFSFSIAHWGNRRY